MTASLHILAIHYSLIIQPFGAIQCQLLTELLNQSSISESCPCTELKTAPWKGMREIRCTLKPLYPLANSPQCLPAGGQIDPRTPLKAVYSKGKAVPVEAWTGAQGSRRFRLPAFLDNRHVTVVRSALRTGRLYSQKVF
jgi:hypothetical protein